MRLSELKKLRPDVWEILRSECIRLYGNDDWNDSVKNNYIIFNTIIYSDSNQGFDIWSNINLYSDFTLMDKWIAKNATA